MLPKTLSDQKVNISCESNQFDLLRNSFNANDLKKEKSDGNLLAEEIINEGDNLTFAPNSEMYQIVTSSLL